MLNTMDGRCLLDMSRGHEGCGRTEHSGLNDHWVALLLNQDTLPLIPFASPLHRHNYFWFPRPTGSLS